MADVVDIIDSSGSTLFDNILTACLYLGAVFQLICIFSVIILPEREDPNVDNAVRAIIYRGAKFRHHE